MGPQEYVDQQVRRAMAQALEEFEKGIEQPLDAALSSDGDAREALIRISGAVPGVKRAFRKRLQTLGSDLLVLIPGDVQINAYEPVRRRA
jgi:hypothetical protein